MRPDHLRLAHRAWLRPPPSLLRGNRAAAVRAGPAPGHRDGARGRSLALKRWVFKRRGEVTNHHRDGVHLPCALLAVEHFTRSLHRPPPLLTPQFNTSGPLRPRGFQARVIHPPHRAGIGPGRFRGASLLPPPAPHLRLESRKPQYRPVRLPWPPFREPHPTSKARES